MNELPTTEEATRSVESVKSGLLDSAINDISNQILYSPKRFIKYTVNAEYNVIYKTIIKKLEDKGYEVTPSSNARQIYNYILISW